MIAWDSPCAECKWLNSGGSAGLTEADCDEGVEEPFFGSPYGCYHFKERNDREDE